MTDPMPIPPGCEEYFEENDEGAWCFRRAVHWMTDAGDRARLIPLDQLTPYQRGIAAALAEVGWQREAEREAQERLERASLARPMHTDYASYQEQQIRVDNARACRAWGSQ